MYELFTRTLSQGLQALLPIAFCLVWVRLAADRSAITGIRWGAAAAVPLTVLAGYLFQRSLQQAQWEALLATIAVALSIWFTRTVWRRGPAPGEPSTGDRRLRSLAFAAGTALIIVRQAMEIAVVVEISVLQLRSLDATRAISAGVILAVVVIALWSYAGRRMPSQAFTHAARTFAAIFLGQAALYAFHEAAESRFLPWSEVLHHATEPYGPDGAYGRYVSYALVLLPALAAILTPMARGVPARVFETWHGRIGRKAVLGTMTAAVACIVLTGVVTRGPDPAPAAAVPTAAAAGRAGIREAIAMSAAPHLLFRGVHMDADYGKLSLAALDTPDGQRAIVEMGCDRVSFAGDRGICLYADRGVLTSYKAIVFDRQFAPVRTFSLAGQPSRTRISPDGRVGTITVFVSGQAHGYVGAAFSTTTTLIDMATGDALGELEAFSTWRNGERFQAKDFNFWGVTFTRDSNVFYATLKTGDTTYLVRGDLGLRKLTVLRDNVECPSISPDNRQIAFKKRVGGTLTPWQFHILDLATMTERPLAAETRSVDDQIEWLDDTHVLYGVPRNSQSALVDVWVAPVDGSGPARVLREEAASPIVVRR
jgi:hypothetical protein